MAIQINIPDAAQCTPLEIEALIKFWQSMSGGECADTSQDTQVIIGHTGAPIHYLTGNEADPVTSQNYVIADSYSSPFAPKDERQYGATAGASDDTDTPLSMEDDIRPMQELDLALLFGNQVSDVHPVPPIAPPPPLGSTELDSNNLPWDARIHAATKAKIADGSWRKKRNLDEALEQSVEAELRSIMGAPVPPPAPMPVPPPAPMPPMPPAPAAVSRVTEGWDQMRQAGTVTNAQHADKMAEIATVTRKLDMTFGEFMKFTTPLLTSGQITQQQLATIAVAVGLPHAVALQKREDMIPAVLQRMYAILDGGV